jgi:hypothetical protein
MFKGSDTSTAESGSEAEDIASPKAILAYSQLRLTPVREEAKAAGKTTYVGNFSGYDEYVPMVDKAVDAIWNKQSATQSSSASKGMVLQSNRPTSPERIGSRIWLALMAFFVTLFTLFRSLVSHMTYKLPTSLTVNDQTATELSVDSVQTGFHHPSPQPGFTDAEILSKVLKRLSELEEKVVSLCARPSQMPYEKEELLNAAVCRVDGLEAELIATKKALHEALMRQEELLAYMDRQEEAKFRKNKFCW